jgi:hypothetical protein
MKCDRRGAENAEVGMRREDMENETKDLFSASSSALSTTRRLRLIFVEM